MPETIDKYFAGVEAVENGLAEDSASGELGEVGSVSGDNLPVAFDWGKFFGGNAIIDGAGASGVVSPFVGVFGTVDVTGQSGGGDETHGCGDRCC